MISVIIPIYNTKKYIVEAIISVLEQHTDKEIILIDDASTDGSLEALRDYMEGQEIFVRKESHEIHKTLNNGKMTLLWKGILEYEGFETVVRAYRNKNNQGVAFSRNAGVKLATGEYIAFLDADDRWKSDKLIKQLALLKKTGACLCNAGRVLINADGTFTQTIIHTPQKITKKMLEKTNYINCSAVVMKRNVALRYPMVHSDVHEDYLTWLKLMKDYRYVVGVDEPLLEYRLSESGKSRNKLHAAKMTYRTYRYAGYGMLKTICMMIAYTLHGLKKYQLKNMF